MVHVTYCGSFVVNEMLADFCQHNVFAKHVSLYFSLSHRSGRAAWHWK